MTDNHNALLGKTAKDAVTGFTGTVICVHRQLSGNVQIGIAPKGDGDKAPDPMFIDVHLVDEVDAGLSDRVQTPDVSPIPLGAEVVDRVSGLKGTVTAETTHINGCIQCAVQPKVDKDGKLPEVIVFDYKRLEKKGAGVSDEARKPLPRRSTGGPSMKVASLRHA